MTTVEVPHAWLSLLDVLAARVEEETKARLDLRPEVEAVPPGTLPKTEFKARRVRDERARRG